MPVSCGSSKRFKNNRAASVVVSLSSEIHLVLLAENPTDLPLVLDLIARYLRNAWQLTKLLTSPTNNNGPTAASNASGAVTEAETSGPAAIQTGTAR